MDRTRVGGAMENGRLGAYAALLTLGLLLFAMPGAHWASGGLKALMGGAMEAEEDLAELGRREIARLVDDRRRWGSLVAAENPALTQWEADEIGRAVLRYSKHYSLQPGLVVAIIMVESGGRLRAVSPRGAQGLMQVMPFWKKELGIEGTLFEIDNNIRAGCHILASNIRRWGYKEGILRYYRGSLPVASDSYFTRVESIAQRLG